VGYQERLELELADVEFATSLVATKVGDRPAVLGTDSLFKLIEDLREEFATVQKAVSVLESPDLVAAREEQLAVGIAQDILNRLKTRFFDCSVCGRGRKTHQGTSWRSVSKLSRVGEPQQGPRHPPLV
jgi:hypothetical protein